MKKRNYLQYMIIDLISLVTGIEIIKCTQNTLSIVVTGVAILFGLLYLYDLHHLFYGGHYELSHR